MTVLRSGGATDVGAVRSNNQDAYLVAHPLFIVADGMGGHAAGEVAAQMAVETVRDAFAANPSADGLADAVRAANQAVWDRAQAEPEMRGMGTTLTAIALVDGDDGDQLAVINVGDSRAYLLRHGELEQVTDDHSLVEELRRDGQLTAEEARVHPQRHILTRALGIAEDVEPDCYRVLPTKGDRWLIASDGLFNELGDRQMSSVLRRFADPDEASKELVRLAKEHGGADNITVVVLDVVDDGGRAEAASATVAHDEEIASHAPGSAADGDGDDDLAAGSITQAQRDARLRALAAEDDHGGADHWRDEEHPDPFGTPHRRITIKMIAFLAALVLVLGAAAGAVVWYAKSSYFVGLDGDAVAIYQGRPGGLLWFEPELKKLTELTLDDVRPARHDDLRNGHEVSSRAAADRYVARLADESGASSTFQPPSTLPPTTSTTAAPPPPPPA